ncbi:hypothetical protein KAX02_05395 [candidate division WOR-3 bacterium]|nr:hypothetical protein [candidate division WOR-3 bacterium]
MKVKVTGGIFKHNDCAYKAGDVLDVSENTYRHYKFTLEKVKGATKETPKTKIVKPVRTRKGEHR